MKKILVLAIGLFLLFSCSSKKDEINTLSKKGKESVQQIAKYLKDPDIEIRKTAIFSLKNIGDASAIPYIEEYVSSAKKAMERQWGIEAISYIGELAKKNKPKPKVVILPVKESDPLNVQVNNFIHNFIVEGNPYNKGEELYLEVKGKTVINYTDMTKFYNDTKRIGDWKTFYQYVKRTVLGFPTGDMAGAIFKKFPSVKVFKEAAYYGIGEKKVKDGRAFYDKKKIVGKASISRRSFKKIDPDTKEYLDKLSVMQQQFSIFEKEVKKFLSGIWYDPSVVKKASNQKSSGTEIKE